MPAHCLTSKRRKVVATQAAAAAARGLAGRAAPVCTEVACTEAACTAAARLLGGSLPPVALQQQPPRARSRSRRNVAARAGRRPPQPARLWQPLELPMARRPSQRRGARPRQRPALVCAHRNAVLARSLGAARGRRACLEEAEATAAAIGRLARRSGRLGPWARRP
eukprot:6719873-Prymnesium_polylepis.1